MKQILALLRVSTTQQDLEAQRKAVTRAIVHDGYSVDDIEYVEKKESAIKLKEEEREGLQEMKELIEQYPSIRQVYTFAVDRLARKVSVVISIKDYLLERGINLVFLNPRPLATMRKNEKGEWVEDEISAMMLLFLSYGAEMEMKIKKARFKAAKELMRTQNKITEAKPIFGYYKDENKYARIDEKEGAIVRDLFNDYLKRNISLRDLYNEYAANDKLPQTKGASARLASIFSNLAYSGQLKKYPMIVTPDIQNAVIAKMKSNKTLSKNGTPNIYLGKHLLVDSTGGRLVGNGGKCNYRSFQVGQTCTVVNINAVDSILWHCAVSLQVNYLASNMLEMHKNYDKDIEKLTKQIESQEKKLEELHKQQSLAFKQLINGKVQEDVYEEMADDLKAREHSITSRMTEYQTEIARIKKLQDTMQESTTLSEKVDDIKTITDDTQRKEIIDSMIQKVIVKKISSTEKEIEVIPKYQYHFLAIPTMYRIITKHNSVQIKEGWRRTDGKMVYINFTGEFLKRYIKDDQGNYKYKN